MRNHKYESVDGNFKERSNSQHHMLGFQISPIQGFSASYFHVWHQNLGRQLEKLYWKVFKKGMKMHMMSHVKVCSSTTYHILLAKFKEFPIEVYTLELTMGFQQRPAHLSPSWPVNKATSQSQHLAEQGFNTWYKSTTMWKTSWGLSHWETHDNPTTSKTTHVDIKKVFLAKEWNSFHLFSKKVVYLHLKDFLNYECELYLKQPLTPPQRQIIVAYRTSNHRLAIEIG